MHEFLVSTAAFIVLVGIMVVVHEFGHFAVAKLCGSASRRFHLASDPRLFGFKYGETDYKVCLLPLGGYVKMTGETPDQISGPEEERELKAEFSGDPGSFTTHPRWQRILIGLAGPFANFILAFVLMVFYFGFINETTSVEVTTTTLDWVTPGSAAASGRLSTRRRDHAFRQRRESRLDKDLRSRQAECRASCAGDGRRAEALFSISPSAFRRRPKTTIFK